LRREASRNLERATADQQRSDSGTNNVGSALRRELENETPSGSVDEAVIRQLISQLKALRVEQARSADEQEDEEWDIDHIDPSRLPPAYRERIQRYYEKLSEQQ
jgi:hypothetical protein